MKTSKEIAEWLFGHSKIKRDHNFKQMLSEFLVKTFEDRVRHHEIIVGESNTPHKFENVILLPSGKRLIVDPVLHDTSSINSRLVANLDVKNAKRGDIQQRIVYDDEDEWTAANLSLLSLGATTVPFSHSQEVIQRIANAT